MAAIHGVNAKVTLGATTVLGIGKWSMDGINVSQADTSAFGSTYATFISGMIDGGTISFDGYYDKDDTTGQIALKNYADAQTHITSLRLYVDSSSYYAPSTTNPVSYVTIQNYTITADKGDAVRTTFQAKVSGKFELI